MARWLAPNFTKLVQLERVGKFTADDARGVFVVLKQLWQAVWGCWNGWRVVGTWETFSFSFLDGGIIRR